MTKELQQTPIPEEFKKLAESAYPDAKIYGQFIGFQKGAEWAYRLLSSQGLRWVKASTRWPDNPTVNQFFTIRPIKEGFDFFMFLRYVRDWDIKDTPTFRWNLWDGFHGWTHRITPDLLPKIEWLLDESPAPIR